MYLLSHVAPPAPPFPSVCQAGGQGPSHAAPALDTLDVRPLPGAVLKHLAERDTVSRWDVFEVASRATAGRAARFLDVLEARMSFPVHAVQVDGGSEFAGAFEQECRRRRIRLFVLPRRSPKVNGRVERANRTHIEEFSRPRRLTSVCHLCTGRVHALERARVVGVA